MKDMNDMNGNRLRVGQMVLWFDPDVEARDLSRVYTIYEIREDFLLIGDEYSEEEVLPSEVLIVSKD